jgi:hypothetical protein
MASKASRQEAPRDVHRGLIAAPRRRANDDTTLAILDADGVVDRALPVMA